ncbi:MAG: right-handed parallel beta-helix repeat-containing protein, partial [Candidatus Bipolaricaulota bacterium]|nr:right-handed parallel beta-helix repeat-containing protein [Candidatus Bipolaricaulota bacterium]MDW8141036.1 right-handed parallel beta-helix repeat-containing protein [Candidatus Bipolaricaulota bacterium]
GNLGAGVYVLEQSELQASKNRVADQKDAGGDRGAGDGFWFQAGSKGNLQENTIENNAGCGVRGTNNPNVVVGANNTIQNNAGGNTCP